MDIVPHSVYKLSRRNTASNLADNGTRRDWKATVSLWQRRAFHCRLNENEKRSGQRNDKYQYLIKPDRSDAISISKWRTVSAALERRAPWAPETILQPFFFFVVSHGTSDIHPGGGGEEVSCKSVMNNLFVPLILSRSAFPSHFLNSFVGFVIWWR